MKILVNEKQLEVIKKHLNEGAVDGDRYENNVKVEVESYGVNINGDDIDWVSTPNIKLSYLIDMEHRSWGIKNVSLYSIQGPSEIELTITPQVEDSEDINITVSLDWENIDIEEMTGNGVITVGDEITITLGNNENGDIIVKSITVPVYTL